MTSARRAGRGARTRQVAMYLSKQLTPRSLPEIVRRFGGRDHTTVIHAVRQIEKLRQSDAELDADIRLRSEEHTSELQSLMSISYAVFCLKKKIKKNTDINTINKETPYTHK